MTQNAWFIAHQATGHTKAPPHSHAARLIAPRRQRPTDKWWMHLSMVFSLLKFLKHTRHFRILNCVPSLEDDQQVHILHSRSTISLELKVRKDDADRLTAKFLGLMGFDRRMPGLCKASWAQLPRLPFIHSSMGKQKNNPTGFAHYQSALSSNVCVRDWSPLVSGTFGQRWRRRTRQIWPNKNFGSKLVTR